MLSRNKRQKPRGRLWSRDDCHECLERQLRQRQKSIVQHQRRAANPHMFSLINLNHVVAVAIDSSAKQGSLAGDWVPLPILLGLAVVSIRACVCRHPGHDVWLVHLRWRRCCWRNRGTGGGGFRVLLLALAGVPGGSLWLRYLTCRRY